METRRNAFRRAATPRVRKLRRAQSAIRGNQEIYRSIFDNAAIGIARTDAHGRLVQVNETWLAMLKYQRGEVIGHPPEDFTHPGDRKDTHEKLAAMIAGRIDRYRLEKRYLRKDGTPVWVDVIVSAVRDDSGSVLSTIALCADISERVETERALRRQQRLMSDLLNSTKEGFWFIDNAARTVDVNPAMCALLGRPRGEIIGHNIYEFVDEANAAIFRAEIEARKDGKTGGYEIALQRPDGSRTPCLNNATPLFDEEGRKIGSVGLWADITHIKEVQRQLEQAKDEAQAANRAKSAFLATMSHEIRTPLNGVISVIELLSDSPATPEQRVQIGLARKAADQLLNIIGNVLDMSKLESGRIKIEAVPFDLDGVVDAAAETFAAEAARKELDLLVDCDPIEYQLVGDPTRLKQILLNLVGNAVKFTSAGAVRIRVEVSRAGAIARLAIAVRDTGIGIPDDVIPQLMQKFVQASAATTRQYGGSGLGLAICKQLAEAMGGTLQIQSEVGTGSTFRLELMLPVSEQLGTTRPAPGRRELILLSDNSELQSVFGRLAASDGHRHVPARDADAAVQILERKGSPPRIVVIDEAACRGRVRAELEKLAAAGQPIDRTFVLATAGLESRMLADGHTAEVILKPLTRSKLKLISSFGSPYAGTAPAARSGQPRKASPCLVLVVEDNSTNQYVVRKTLERLDCAVHVAADGVEALTAAAQQRFDLILMDLQMPRLDGITATRRIRAEAGPNRHTPIIAITANAFTDDVQQCLDAGMNGHLSKPLRRQALAAIIEKIVHERDFKAHPAHI